MKHLKIMVCLVLLLTGLMGYAQKNDQMIGHLLKNMKLEKPLISKMIDDLQKMGKITESQAIAAKKELKGLSHHDLEKYKQVAVKKIESGDSQRLMDHDYKKGSPKLDQPSLLEKE